jgi:(p)ppGpp synthase/HD superfamily hydrolase
MASMRVHLTRDEYLSVVDNLQGLPGDLRRIVRLAEIIANDCLEGIFRRDGTPAIVHSRAMATKAWELGISPRGQAIAWLHDVLEENPSITPWSIYWSYGPYDGASITDGVIALTKCLWMSDEVYFGRIIEASIVNWEVIVDKMIDRWHFHSDSYNGPVEKELAKIEQTQGIFLDTCLECADLAPNWFRPSYDNLLNDIIVEADNRYRVLTSR